jgi:hypothetical protein
VVDHSIFPADWQRNASVLLLPLKPQPYFNNKFRLFEWCSVFWHPNMCPHELLCEQLNYKVGDRAIFPGGKYKEIKAVKVLLAEQFTADMLVKSGIDSFLEVAPKWNERYSYFPWHPNLWIVGLELMQDVES